MAPSVALAGIIYEVNRTIGAASVIGTIETNGSIGPLIGDDFVDWTITIHDGVDTFQLLGPNSGDNSSVTVRLNKVFATTSNLMFDFGGRGFLAFTGSQSIWRLEGSGGNEFVYHNYNNLTPHYSSVSQVPVLSVFATIPEPSTLAILALGIMGLGFRRIKNQ